MKTADWLEDHREEIVERWKARVRPIVCGAPADEWEQRVSACFDQVRGLVTNGGVALADPGVEERLFECRAVTSVHQHRLAAWMLASGRRAIGDVTTGSMDIEAQACAEECGSVINYLEHALQINICQDCPLVGCCMRVQVTEPMLGGLNE